MDYIYREITPSIEHGANYYPVVVISGPAGSGKSTLCRHVFASYKAYDLTDLALREKIMLDPRGFLKDCGEKTILNELQHIPELVSFIRMEVDEHPERRFILTGSNRYDLMESMTKSLAVRAAMYTLLPLSISELEGASGVSTDTLLFNGFFPSVAAGLIPASEFHSKYYTTYVERDVRHLRNLTDIAQFQKFMRILAGRVGSELNASQIAGEIGVSSPTVKSWIGLLETSYIALQLHPYFININKRLTKTPKIYFYDTGLLCFLLGIRNAEQLSVHPLRGAIFENVAVIELLKRRFNDGKLSNIYFYRENKGREVDIVQEFGAGLDIYEVRSSQTFNKSFLRNLDYLQRLLGDRVSSRHLVYDGDPIPPYAINIRRIADAR